MPEAPAAGALRDCQPVPNQGLGGQLAAQASHSPGSRQWHGPRQGGGSGGPAFLRKLSGSWSTPQGCPSSARGERTVRTWLACMALGPTVSWGARVGAPASLPPPLTPTPAPDPRVSPRRPRNRAVAAAWHREPWLGSPGAHDEPQAAGPLALPPGSELRRGSREGPPPGETGPGPLPADSARGREVLRANP